MYNKLLLFISIIIIIFSLIIIINNKYDAFKVSVTPKFIADNDGNMNFDFLKAENSQDVIKRYYIDDDKKINGIRVNYHRYQQQVYNPVPIDPLSHSQKVAFPYIYGNTLLHYQRTPGEWNKYDTQAQQIYNNYGVRR